MELKKNPKFDLEKKSSLFIQIGLVVTLLMTYGLFNLSFSEGGVVDLGDNLIKSEEEEIIPITRQQDMPPPPPPPAQEDVTEELEIVDDKKETNESFDKKSSETDENDKTDIKKIVVDTEEASLETEIFRIVEDMPEYPGGEDALVRYLGQNTKYPDIAKDNGISGIVYVSYVVNPRGEVTNVEVARSVDPYLDKEAIRVVKTLKGYKPGKQRGKPVNVRFTVPIRFVLQ